MQSSPDHPYRHIQLTMIFIYLPQPCSGVERGGGASAPGPGTVVGARAKLDFFFFLIGSQWGIQDFDKGGGHLKKKLAERSVTILYLHTNKHTHKIIAINTRLYVLFYSNTCWNPGFRGIMHLHKKRRKI